MEPQRVRGTNRYRPYRRLRAAVNRRIEAELLSRGFSRDYQGCPDFDDETNAFVERVSPYTTTSPERIASLRAAVQHISRLGIPGSIVECGVGRGGSMLAAALTLVEEDDTERELWLFDTFVGHPAPTEEDVDLRGRSVSKRSIVPDFRKVPAEAAEDWVSRVRNLLSDHYPSAKIRIVQGLVEETIPESAPSEIALLRLDTDFYASTRHELEHLYPRLSEGGVLILDDYGHYRGARQAVDEYFAATPVFLHRIDYSGRLLLKERSA